ncbi:MAG: chemotaxis protein CheX [Candidatus Zixiibacteriota bacterium]
MSKDKNEILSNVFCSVLEMQAFMFAEPAEAEDLPREVNDCVMTKIGYNGDQNGIIEMAVPSDMALELAANILGMELDDEFAKQKANDALKELLNIICGNVITDLHGTKADISPTIPEIETLSAQEWKDIMDKNSLYFIVDEIPVILRNS